MTAVDPASISTTKTRADEAAKARRLARINKLDGWLRALGLPFVAPILRMAAGDPPKQHLKDIWRLLGVPVLAVAIFVTLWAQLAPMVQTSLGAIPGPKEVLVQAVNLHQDARAEQAKEAEFYARQAEKNAVLVEGGKAEEVKTRAYTGKPTYYQQIWTSIQTVFFGFLIATAVAVPLGIVSGLSPTANAAINPLVQIFKPVSPLAWLPIVTMVISAVYVGGDGSMSKSFLISAVTVTLCSLWPTLINTALGVASIDKDLVSVSRVLKLGPWKKITRLVLPSALPLIFTGLRLSLGVGWMVLIAAEMLAQNPGLGKFVWDEFQNGSSDSLARIMVAVLTIGIIGFLLDRVMYALQSAFTFSNNR
ncbi:MAG: nitrate ABC transporter permease [Rhodobacter sp.]|nr:nitrate ABC transporter permease [Rhodobacter sp.]